MQYDDDLSKFTSDQNDIRRYEHNVEENHGKKTTKSEQKQNWKLHHQQTKSSVKKV